MAKLPAAARDLLPEPLDHLVQSRFDVWTGPLRAEASPSGCRRDLDPVVAIDPGIALLDELHLDPGQPPD